MASISSTNSIGNTSLRGYGGMASGIDRDAIIEKMTLGTTTKINNQKGKITQLQWKQEAYRNISDQILDFGDKYTSFSSTDSLKDSNFFAKSIISVHGRDEATRFVTATGSSDLISNISIKGVKQLATSTVRQSNKHYSQSGLQTSLDDLNAEWRSSKLQGTQLIFEKTGEHDTTTDRVAFVLPDGYEVTNPDGTKTTKKIKYTGTTEEIVNDLNAALATATDAKFGNTTLDKAITFVHDKTTDSIRLQFTEEGKKQGFQIRGGSTALGALGYNISSDDNYLVDLDKLEDFHGGDSFQNTGIRKPSALDEMTGKKLTFNYDGSQKEVELVTEDEAKELKELMDKGESQENVLQQMANNLQTRLNRAFGTNMVKAELKDFTDKDGKKSKTLSFTTENLESTISIVANDYSLLTNLGISYGESNKVNLDGKLDQAALLGKNTNIADFEKDGELDLQINGVAIKGLTKDSSINDIVSKINSTSAAGVKATYVSATGQFMLVSTETGAGRDISLESELSKRLFGGTKKDADGSELKDDEGNPIDNITKGQDAIISVSYGNGVDIDIKRASNTFNLEGLNVTVTGTFGGEYKKDADGNFLDKSGNITTNDKEKVWNADNSQTVTFSAKADVDAIVERVKGFFEDFNKLATDINTEITTRPDSSYGPLTDEQKDEMDETSIENWEKKAKQGMLYGDSAMRDLSTDVQSIFLKLMNSLGRDGYDKLKEMGITYSDDYGDGGTISFDESKFRTAVEKDSEAVGNIFTGGGGVSKGLVDIMDETFTPYATRYASKNGNGGKGSYGRLIEIAGSEKKPTSLLNNQIYNEIEDIQDLIARLQEQLKGEQDRYISQFTTMETLLNKMNTQSSYLSQLTG